MLYTFNGTLVPIQLYLVRKDRIAWQLLTINEYIHSIVGIVYRIAFAVKGGKWRDSEGTVGVSRLSYIIRLKGNKKKIVWWCRQEWRVIGMANADINNLLAYLYILRERRLSSTSGPNGSDLRWNVWCTYLYGTVWRKWVGDVIMICAYVNHGKHIKGRPFGRESEIT